ncbi:MAG: DUF721 domain-containing protein [Planctomycetota bacterium]|nr:DUF721 domain-containing protein [Planctomycetota bacterium]
MDEPDVEWRRWFMEMAVRRGDMERGKTARIIHSAMEKGGKSIVITRKKARPELAATWVKKETKQFNSKKIAELQDIKELWRRLVGFEIAAESQIISFSRGALTVEVSSATLFQELRQFHHDPLLRDLRDAWPAKTSLLRIKFQLGRKK